MTKTLFKATIIFFFVEVYSRLKFKYESTERLTKLFCITTENIPQHWLLLNLVREGNTLLQYVWERHTKVWCNITQLKTWPGVWEKSAHWTTLKSLHKSITLTLMEYRSQRCYHRAFQSKVRLKLIHIQHVEQQSESMQQNTTGLEWDHAVRGNVIRHAAVVSTQSLR